MFNLWRFMWWWSLLLLLFMFLMNKVAAKWPPDDSQPQFYTQNWPPYYVDDFAIDTRSFGNEKSVNGNGNSLFGKTIADERTLQDLFQANDIAIPAAEERRQQKLQWLGSWLFGHRQEQTTQRQQQQQQTPELKQSQGQVLQLQFSPPQKQQQQLQKPQQQQKHQKSWYLNGNSRQNMNFYVYKKAPEIFPDDGDKNPSRETNFNEIDVSANAGEVEKRDGIVDATLGYDYYKSVSVPASGERYDFDQTPSTECGGFARARRLDFAYIPYTAYKTEQKRKLNEAKKLSFKRNKTGNIEQRSFLPSISGGALTHLGNFFTDLSKNVHYNEKIQPLSHPQAKLLEGEHPLRQLHEKIAGEHEANAEFLHAIRTYRPSQKIRSLVSMNPRGYHGAQFIDPNYIWVGLGK